jgi:ubiquinone/menaquinone biosynthesis C-methylase UbiE
VDKVKVAAFFDKLAPDWDQNCKHDKDRIRRILDLAGVESNLAVLDVACGTGVLFPFYLERNVAKITGVDLSPRMIERAREKFNDPRIEFIAGDVEQLALSGFDRCVVYNALPHFEDSSRLIKTLSDALKPGGRLTIAHGESRDKINERHTHGASEVSLSLMPADELSLLFAPFFYVDVLVDGDIYAVSGIKK